MNLRDLKNDWLQNYPQPMVIAGPCSAESEEQMLETARGIKEANAKIDVFRAGIWKPRTKPGSFEGVGVIGLSWLKKVKEEFGFKTATEVANAHHVYAALEADVDILWVGARSTVNPFTVQEIAVALKGTDKPVLVKNPVNPDLALWVGALERLLAQDVKNLGAIHRGFSTYQKTQYRNIPNWHIALDFKNQFPNIPMFVDPSHICGNREGLFDITQEALNVGYEGAMIETHCTPDKAWSDASQQITPSVLDEMISRLKVRTSDISGYEDDMGKHRALISDIDFQLMELLSNRMRISEKIGTLKKENNIAIFQPERWKEITEYARKKADETGMSQDFIEKIFKAIHEESIEVQNKVMIGSK
ncbi:3-deoxy-7-phosphoheptulonate synthase [Riemerella anatipestifer]|uniref:chorismate mutase n=1 Tax=Riemerella anatipestifer TaxID=34085 RepID=UPI00129D6F68|nr:chorismate mutase [Riemerella anatipestifer]MBO4234169.1 3-deoxy-7-phosphoheptulonate synthase [Riemerella anatipestifer]MDY3364264.1 chorismate mutase [Riemerella anatipestifer]MDY3521024.1 chorismate mutase [Riemerella anatipestifer]MDY3533215.1 chorismate mutase [Riemerella anatipestifer]MDY3535319.1 chorismate mutase [Riemerella anatipestifer]